MAEKRLALLSVFHKDGLEEFAQGLVNLNFNLVSSGGTAKYLKEKGFDIIDVSQITGYPAILDHRVVTLHPKIHGGILALKTDGHENELDAYSIDRIHLVCVDLYPVIQAIAKDGATVERVMELTDIGGPTMIRGAAKNHQNVIVICDPADRREVLYQLNMNEDLDELQRRRLAEKVFETMELYDGAIRKFLAEKNGKTVDSITLFDGIELAYAENRCQNPAHLFSVRDDDPLAPSKFEWVSGIPSYIAMADGMQIVDILCLLAECFRRSDIPIPFITIAGKHGNPCGVGVALNPIKSIHNALMGDPVAVMGGEVVTNFFISDEVEAALFHAPKEIGRDKWGLDLVIAPNFSQSAVKMLGEREKRRLLANLALTGAPFPQHQWVYRQVRNEWLRQAAPTFALTPDNVSFWSSPQRLINSSFADALIAFACCWRASSNTVALAKDKMLIGLGCGQQDRIACVRLCLDRANRAGHNPEGSVFASDGFFPFAESSQKPSEIEMDTLKEYAKLIIDFPITPGGDQLDTKAWSNLAVLIAKMDRREGPQLLADAGCAGGIVPADGKNLEEVRKFFEKREMAVGFIPPQYRGFSKH